MKFSDEEIYAEFEAVTGRESSAEAEEEAIARRRKVTGHYDWNKDADWRELGKAIHRASDRRYHAKYRQAPHNSSCKKGCTKTHAKVVRQPKSSPHKLAWEADWRDKNREDIRKKARDWYAKNKKRVSDQRKAKRGKG